MTNRVIQGIGLLCLVAILTIPSWMCGKHYGNYVAVNEWSKVAKMTKHQPVISAMRDVGVLSDKTDCRRLFGEESSAHNFSMSKDFRENIAEFLLAVNASIDEELEGNTFRYQYKYMLMHYMVTHLKFVRTVCETGMDYSAVISSYFEYLSTRKLVNAKVSARQQCVYEGP